MADNKKITDLPASIPSGGFNFIAAAGAPTNTNYRVTYVDIAEYSSIDTKTGQFTDSLSLSGSPVIPTNKLIDGNITYYSGERIRGNNNRLTINHVGVGINDSNPNYTLEVGGDLNVHGNIYTGGSILNVVSEQLNISGALITVNSGEPGAGVTTDLAGLLVDRGSLPSGYMLFTESYKGWSPSHNFVVTGGLNLGIGTTTPTSALHMASGKLTALTGEFSDSLTISGVQVTTGDLYWQRSPGYLEDIYYDAGTVRIYNTTLDGEQVKIHTHSVPGDNTAQAQLGALTNLIGPPGGNAFLSLSAGAPGSVEEGILLNTATDCFISGQNFGVGTNLPSARLHVTGGDGRILAPSGDFSKSLTISGLTVLTSTDFTHLESEIATVSGNVDTVSGNLVATGAYLVSEIATVSGNVDTVSGDVNGILTTGLSTQSGIFSKALTISGVAVSTGAEGKWADGVDAGDIYYSGGNVGISGDLRVSGNAYFTPETIYVGQAPLSSDGKNLSGHGLVLNNPAQIRPDYDQGTGSFSNPVYNSITPSGYLTVRRVGKSHIELTVFANWPLYNDLIGSNIKFYHGTADGTRIVQGLDLWQNERVAYSGSYPDLVQYPGSSYVNSVKVNKWGTVLGISNIDQEYFFGVKFENGAFEGYPFSVARTNVPVKDMDIVESYYGSPQAAGGTSSCFVPYIPALWNSELTGANANFTDSLTISGVSVSTGVGGGGGTPGGSDTNVQFNDGGSFGGSSSLIYSNTANYLSGASGIFDHLSGHQILAPSGDFTESLTISGVPVITGYKHSYSGAGPILGAPVSTTPITYFNADSSLGDTAFQKLHGYIPQGQSGGLNVEAQRVTGSSIRQPFHCTAYVEDAVALAYSGWTLTVGFAQHNFREFHNTATDDTPFRNYRRDGSTDTDVYHIPSAGGVRAARASLSIPNDRLVAPGYFDLFLESGTTYVYVIDEPIGFGVTDLGASYHSLDLGRGNVYGDSGSFESLTVEIGNVGIGTPGPTARLHVTGGQILAPSGTFTESLTISGVSVSTGVGGGGGTPGGSDTNVQFNDGGSFGGSSSLIYSNTANYLSGASGIFDHLSGHTGYFRDYASGATGEWDFTTGSTGHWEEEVIVGTGDDVALIANDAGNVGIGWSGTPIQPIGAQLHVSGSTIISGSSEVTLDYTRLPKSNPNITGRVWIDGGSLMVSAG